MTTTLESREDFLPSPTQHRRKLEVEAEPCGR